MTHVCLFCGGDASRPNHLAYCDGRQGRVVEPFEPYRAPFAVTSETSRAAAHSVEPTAVSLCGQILAALKARGASGLTCAEVEDRFGLRHQTASARLWDLRTRAYIRDSGARRETSSGRKAVVWVAA
jgi:hypothetical protein